jgi:hypothetical protein
MSKSAIRFSRLGAAAFAVAITGFSAWMFVSSSASAGRDPFRFAAVMAANAEIHATQVAQERSRTAARYCWNKSLAGGRPDSGSMPECRRG